MADLSHVWGSDLQVNASGDLATVAADQEVQQRLLRRLLTAAGDYKQQPAYGAGVGALVGLPANAGRISGLIKRQMKKEASILQNPPPSVAVLVDPIGAVAVTISYTDATTGQPATLNFPLVGS